MTIVDLHPIMNQQTNAPSLYLLSLSLTLILSAWTDKVAMDHWFFLLMLVRIVRKEMVVRVQGKKFIFKELIFDIVLMQYFTSNTFVFKTPKLLIKNELKASL